ncbi:hypothetical protein SAMN02745121_01447 [Nannocystis exedens]|uniref:Uncharacterized protein n=1 Tax=Nannocystis exedens TaxID=54 RepID=A0A1I1V5K1_9BACT|nr:hypothetical protein [Nannocystis exedens]PCC72247.1 hypothetical protein NAEX_05326 [Nannocystis exedens]SFD76373.1 hypothetical protein SAMN02745121_01447 [Nannocystis exedens]
MRREASYARRHGDPVLRYRFDLDTAKLGPQLARNGQAGLQRAERAYGRALVKKLVPEFKRSDARRPERLAALRERVKTGPKIEPKAFRHLGRCERWLLAALAETELLKPFKVGRGKDSYDVV